VNIKLINKLISVLENSGISEIEITDFWGRKIKIIKSSSVSHSSTLSAPKVIVEDRKKGEEKNDKGKTGNAVPIRSPIVGTFYRSPSPDAHPYVEVGDIIKPGQVVCIVEAMKLMNEIESDVAGRVIQILAKNEDPVEYNQELFLVEPL
jgi:acetyl-CoA carboxylase biotin carboxyl carrier protein